MSSRRGTKGMRGMSGMSGRHRTPGPPAYVPTLTDIVYPVPTPALASVPSDESVSNGQAAAKDLQALMVQQVLARVKLDLDKRLHEAAGQLVHEHVNAMLPGLANAMEHAVHALVAQAFERASAELQMAPEPAAGEGKPPVS